MGFHDGFLEPYDDRVFLGFYDYILDEMTRPRGKLS